MLSQKCPLHPWYPSPQGQFLPSALRAFCWTSLLPCPHRWLNLPLKSALLCCPPAHTWPQLIYSQSLLLSEWCLPFPSRKDPHTFNTLKQSIRQTQFKHRQTVFECGKWIGFGGRGPRFSARYVISLVCDDKKSSLHEGLPCAKSFT